MTDTPTNVIGGVDTHADTLQAAAIDHYGRLFGSTQFPTTANGYQQLAAWLRRHGRVDRVGVEGSGSYGAALTRYLQACGLSVAEVNRPHAHTAARRGKTDDIDAEAAARKVLAGECTAVAKDTTGAVEAIRHLLITRASAVKSRTAALNQFDKLLVTAGQNIERLSGETAFAHLCAADPIPASSGKTSRHRLNPFGDRDANRALHMITVVRLRYCARTRAYLARRTTEGLSKKDVIRCLKRYIAREIYYTLRADLKNLALPT